MPRQRSAGRPAPARPTVPACAAPAPTQQQTRPGLFGQIASTAAGVAVGSSIGHSIGGLFSGGYFSTPEAAADAADAAPQQTNMQNQNAYAQNNCAAAAESFSKCMDNNNDNMQICNWYL
ncbi:hypothetical protein F5Y19DRAFT_481801 [Xylariaceae sp. FL1651]|nr:hypothetical protein F5Y19DRAFT_481801 [Xylariaceae sp. FL1651]